MNALGAQVGEATETDGLNDCAALFPESRDLRTLALNGAGVFAFDAGSPASGDLSATRFKGLTVMADARIDGRLELGRALGIAPDVAVAAPAAELIARAWRRWGNKAPGRLVGDYAFLVWEPEARSLFLVRDYFGERPLHYHEAGNRLLAASLPSALAAAMGAARINLYTLARYHALLPQTGPDSFFQGVKRVEPGTIVRWRGGRLDVSRYWFPPRAELQISRDEAAEEVKSLLRAAVLDRGHGASGVASHLSAGMDSSAVAAALGENGVAATVITGEDMQRDPAPAGYISTESDIAAATAALYPSLRHVIAHPMEGTIADRMGEWNCALDQPIRSIDNAGWLAATYREAAASGASVLMTGGFGNNSFSYDGTTIFADLLRRGRLGALMREGRRHRAVTGARWRGIFGLALGPAIPEAFWRWYRGKPHWRVALAELTLFRPSHPILDELRARAIADRHDMAERPIRSPWHARVQEVRWVDNGLFDYGVRNRWGVTPTDPTADRRLVEFTLQLPAHHWMEKGRTRALARRVLDRRVAPEVVDPPGRGLQGSGWRAAAEACLPQLRDEVARQRGTEWGELLDLDRIDSMLANWPSTGWSDYGQLFLYQASLLRAISMGHFARVRTS